MGFKVPMPCLPWAGAASASGQTMRRGGGVALGQAPPPPSQPHRKTELRDSVSWSEPATSAGLGRQTLLQWAQTDYGTSQPKMMRGLRLLPDGGVGGLQKTSASAPPLLQPSPLDSAELSLTLESSLWPCPHLPHRPPGPAVVASHSPVLSGAPCSCAICLPPPPAPAQAGTRLSWSLLYAVQMDVSSPHHPYPASPLAPSQHPLSPYPAGPCPARPPHLPGMHPRVLPPGGSPALESPGRAEPPLEPTRS